MIACMLIILKIRHKHKLQKRIGDWSSYSKQTYEKAKERLFKVMRYSFQRLE